MKADTQANSVFETRTVHSKGKPLSLAGKVVRPGDKAPLDVQVLTPEMQPFRLGEDTGKARMYSVTPSLDTSVCNKQTVTFNQMIGELGSGTTAYAVSADLPFAQKRFAEHYKVDHMKVVSDYRDVQFGENFGLLIKELRLLTRAVVVVDKNDTVTYMEIMNETGNEPDYQKAIAALKEAMGK